MDEFAKNDQENDEAWDPAPELVCMYNFVSEQRHKEGGGGDDNHAGVAWHIGVHCVEQLRTNDGVYGRPSDARKDVKDGNC